MQDGVKMRVSEDPASGPLGGDGRLVADGVVAERADLAPDASESSGPASGLSQGFRATSTVFWIPGVAHHKDRPTVADKLASLPAESPQVPPPTIVVTDSPRAVPAPNPTPVPRREPFRVGDYEVAARIAQGGTGSVYLCRKVGIPGPSRLYALKVIRQHANYAEASRAFQREAYLGAFLNHPKLQRVIEVGTYEQQPFLILDYVEGASLGDLLVEGPRPPVRAVVSILLDVLRGLHHAHTATDERGAALGIVHGDISPSNILLGVDGSARVTDFGSATLARERLESGDGTRFGGKPAYTAPEILCGEGADARSDIFSLGVTMWQLLTGQKLFVGDTADQTLVNVLRKRVPPPSSLGAPECLDDICLRACVRAPEGRFASAEEMAQALARVATENQLQDGTSEVSSWVKREWGERLEERRRWAHRAFSSPASDSGGVDKGLPSAASAGAERRLPAKTIQLSAVEVAPLLESAAALEATRWVSPPERKRKATPPPSPVAGEDDDEDDKPPLMWWRRPWVIVGISAALAFALTLGAATYLERGSDTPGQGSQTAGTLPHEP